MIMSLHARLILKICITLAVFGFSTVNAAPGDLPHEHTASPLTAGEMIAGLIELAPMAAELDVCAIDRTIDFIRLNYQDSHRRKITNSRYVTIVDFSQPSRQKRMYVFDLLTGKVARFWAAHGKNSGLGTATVFGDEHGSLKTSLGFFLTGEKVTGENVGPALVLHGHEASNQNAFSRGILLHGADYVGEAFLREIEKSGEPRRLGRSFGCPAVEQTVILGLRERLENGSVFYHHHTRICQTPVAWVD